MTRLPSISAERARALMERFSGASVLIAGDAMLDEFVIGRVHRISPEAPVPVLEFDHEEHRLGGAANVAHNIAALGGTVDLVAVVGADRAAECIAEHLDRHRISVEGIVIDPARQTTRKVRMVTERNQQLARIDYETPEEVSSGIEAALIERCEQAATAATLILVSDYQKGVITAGLMARLTSLAQERGIPLLVDPKLSHLAYCAGATLVTPNTHEAEGATHTRIRSLEDAQRAARLFRDKTGSRGVLITRGDQGMLLADGDDEGYLPAAAREVADVTGAGDTVIATLGLALAAGATNVEAASLANHAAGVVVGRFGTVAITPTELMRAVETDEGQIPHAPTLLVGSR